MPLGEQTASSFRASSASGRWRASIAVASVGLLAIVGGFRSRRTHDIADKVAAQAQEYGEKALEEARNIRPFVEKSLKEQPMATLAALAVIGFALGALWRK